MEPRFNMFDNEIGAKLIGRRIAARSSHASHNGSTRSVPGRTSLNAGREGPHLPV
jgi:hypothetical protein